MSGGREVILTPCPGCGDAHDIDEPVCPACGATNPFEDADPHRRPPPSAVTS